MSESGFKLSIRSRRALLGVHSDLVLLASRAIQRTTVDFVITEGLRTIERQERLVAIGASRTMNSRHLTGHAIDVAAWHDGAIRWDWPLYDRINEGFALASSELGIGYEWGGNWTTFKDGPHFQLPADALR